eukprot:scaffold15968_cov46-Cyclotella_meneghiniana.AAC.4
MIQSPRPCPLSGERCSTIRISALLRQLDCSAIDEPSANRFNGLVGNLWKVSLDQRPIIMIRKRGTSSSAMAMAPPDLMEWVPKSPFSTPRLA